MRRVLILVADTVGIAAFAAFIWFSVTDNGKAALVAFAVFAPITWARLLIKDEPRRDDR